MSSVLWRLVVEVGRQSWSSWLVVKVGRQGWSSRLVVKINCQDWSSILVINIDVKMAVIASSSASFFYSVSLLFHWKVLFLWLIVKQIVTKPVCILVHLLCQSFFGDDVRQQVKQQKPTSNCRLTTATGYWWNWHILLLLLFSLLTFSLSIQLLCQLSSTIAKYQTGAGEGAPKISQKLSVLDLICCLFCFLWFACPTSLSTVLYCVSFGYFVHYLVSLSNFWVDSTHRKMNETNQRFAGWLPEELRWRGHNLLLLSPKEEEEARRLP